MDSDCVLAPDMLEQLLKFTPTAEEKEKLEEHADEVENLSRADRFLFDISKLVIHYTVIIFLLILFLTFIHRKLEII